MGFLDHSTNNIIIDAVLTDKGRELLAKNNGTFRISHYSFGDDGKSIESIGNTTVIPNSVIKDIKKLT